MHAFLGYSARCFGPVPRIFSPSHGFPPKRLNASTFPPPDAIPKKRGPKTDVLEALLKRVDGLEKRLQDEKDPISPTSPDKQQPDDLPLGQARSAARRNTLDASAFNPYATSDSRPALSSSLSQNADSFPRLTSHDPSPGLPPQSAPQNGGLSDVLLDAFFARLHGKPFYILDEAGTRQRHQLNQLPVHLAMAISAMTLR